MADSRLIVVNLRNATPTESEELEKARAALDAMSRAQTIAEFEHEWQRLLACLSRAWNKLSAAYRRHAGWSVCIKQYESSRKDDELLVYLTEARNADEHTLADTTERVPGRFAIGPPPGKRELHIKELTIRKGEVNVQSVGGHSVRFTPARVRLLPIKGRHRTYPVPTQHLGKFLTKNDPVEVARLGIEFYRKAFQEVESVLVDQRN